MVRLTIVFLAAVYWSGVVLAEGPSEEAPELILDSPTATKVNYREVETETITVYESRMFPGFRACTPEDYRKQDDPIACQDDNVARMLSTRDPSSQRNDLIVRDNVNPSGNIYKLRFERFKRKKQN